ncbi:bifunctional metallophosphatase/5'-nucleotidase [Nonlabens xiamenensis]|uniref:bifunctional metallophosphatase/5'-nucleotidase n=1 Tax=Nonlabens xiamenensis TaxID=2341043 RepID=UPI000F605571|nr:metallophosphatase [Nonlabens xiamenensis]
MKRRKFIERSSSALVGAALFSNHALAGGLASPTKETGELKTISILHTNDTHSHIEPIASGRNQGKGGVARRAYTINEIRKENPNTLLLDCGDIFQGTPYFNFYGGELEIKLMSMMGYDAATLGNHDFDNGIDGLYKQLPHANFDFVISNYDFANTIMDGHSVQNKVYVIDGVRVGLFGLGIELTGLVDPKLYKETKYIDPIEIAQDQARILKEEEQCDLVICMSHLGYSYRNEKVSDLKLAEATSGIDLIIGGHTHTFLDRPEIVTNIKGNQVLVNQVGCYGINLGRVDFYFKEGKTEAGGNIVYNI